MQLEELKEVDNLQMVARLVYKYQKFSNRAILKHIKEDNSNLFNHYKKATINYYVSAGINYLKNNKRLTSGVSARFYNIIDNLVNNHYGILEPKKNEVRQEKNYKTKPTIVVKKGDVNYNIDYKKEYEELKIRYQDLEKKKKPAYRTEYANLQEEYKNLYAQYIGIKETSEAELKKWQEACGERNEKLKKNVEEIAFLTSEIARLEKDNRELTLQVNHPVKSEDKLADFAKAFAIAYKNIQ